MTAAAQAAPGAAGQERTRSRPYTVDIDIGGTLTDGLFSDGVTVTPVKVDTTPHDFTVCFFECLKEGAKQLGFDDLTALLAQVAVIRWSATIATNIIAERKGPRIGLLVSEETGDELYGRTPSPAVGSLIAHENIVPLPKGASDKEALTAIRALLEQGVRRIAVSMAGGYSDDSAEQAVRRLVDENFPDHYLGAVPLVLGSEILPPPRRPDPHAHGAGQRLRAHAAGRRAVQGRGPVARGAQLQAARLHRARQRRRRARVQDQGGRHRRVEPVLRPERVRLVVAPLRPRPGAGARRRRDDGQARRDRRRQADDGRARRAARRSAPDAVDAAAFGGGRWWVRREGVQRRRRARPRVPGRLSRTGVLRPRRQAGDADRRVRRRRHAQPRALPRRPPGAARRPRASRRSATSAPRP